MAGKSTKKAAAKKKTAKKKTAKKSPQVDDKAAATPSKRGGQVADAAKAAKPRRAGVAKSSDHLSASRLIDARIKELGDWRGKTLSRVRALIKQADPDVVEELKWRKPSNSMAGVPVWSHDGIICTGETYKDKVKLTFARGAALEDPAGLFNAGLEGNTRRAIDFHEGDKIDERSFKCLIRAAAILNAAGGGQ